VVYLALSILASSDLSQLRLLSTRFVLEAAPAQGYGHLDADDPFANDAVSEYGLWSDFNPDLVQGEMQFPMSLNVDEW
jgi:hypothetical protein